MPLDQATRAFVLKWITEGKTREILTLLDTMKDQRDLAELQRDAYLHEIRELSKRTKNILDPLLREPKPTPIPPKTTAKRSKASIDIDIKL